MAEEFTRDWQPKSSYRGQNANMHLTEALMEAFEVTGDRSYLDKAERIADLIIRRAAAANGWRLPEHFTEDWQPDADYVGDPMFHPPGTTPGHSLEWSRLLLQLWEIGGRRHDWMPEAARALFRQALADGWDPVTGGVYYTLDNDGRPLVRERYWWPCTEGIGAAAFLNAIDGAPVYEEWYRRIWDWCATHIIDRTNGTLAAATERCPGSDDRAVLRSHRHLPRAAGLPDPAVSDQRQRRPRPGNRFALRNARAAIGLRHGRSRPRPAQSNEAARISTSRTPIVAR